MPSGFAQSEIRVAWRDGGNGLPPGVSGLGTRLMPARSRRLNGTPA